jgi:hypothetical protein
MRWLVVALLALHGSIHVMGFVKAFRLAELPQLAQPVSRGVGILWLAAAILAIGAAGCLVATPRWWWVAGALALVASQVAIGTSWSDAKWGTLPNALIFIAVVHGVLSQGPTSYRAEYDALVREQLSRPSVRGVVTDADLVRLPEPVARYVRLSGAVGQPRVYNFRTRFRATMRGSASASWMKCAGEQVNRVGAEPSRLFLMTASLYGVPVDVFHAFVGPSATMRAKAWSLVKVVDASGPEMAKSETVTLFNDLCVFAPAALTDPAIGWEMVDERSARATFTNGPYTARALLSFNGAGELIDFVSDDRLRASPDGTRFTPQRWSTPISEYRAFGRRRVGTRGEARWHAPAPEGEFAYGIFDLIAIEYNVREREG